MVEQDIKEPIILAPDSAPPTYVHKPELTISQDGHKIFAVLGYTNQDSKRTIAVHRLPRQFLRMDEEEQKWFLKSQGIAEKLLKRLKLK